MQLSFIKKIFVNFVPGFIKRSITLPFRQRLLLLNDSYSQEGEDLILERFLHDKPNGIFVDIGAHHPIRFSNTYKFYRKGWRGINIDAMPGSMKSFFEVRPEDINLEVAVANDETTLVYYIFNEPALNTFSEIEAKKKDGLNNYKIIDKIELKTQRLETILDKYLPQNKKIDFLTVDVEGLDFEVLRSNNWGKYKPGFILVEDLQNDLEKINSNDLYKFMKSNGYKLVAKTFNTLFFKLL
jgi:FkbM family methyltransferase